MLSDNQSRLYLSSCFFSCSPHMSLIPLTDPCNLYFQGDILLLLLLLLLLTAIGLSPGGSGYFTCIQNMKLVINKFKSGGLHENQGGKECFI